MYLQLRVAIVSALLPNIAYAAAVTYPGGIQLSTLYGHAEISGIATYMLDTHRALGVRTDYIRDSEDYFTTANYSHVVQRWNNEDSRANIIVSGGAGFATQRSNRSGKGDMGMHGGGGGGRDDYDTSAFDDEVAPVGRLALNADWESRRFYLGYETRLFVGEDVHTPFTQQARIGFAPYLADYGGIHSWLMLQVEHRPDDEDELVVTPFVRLFTAEVMGEFGVSLDGDVMVNVSLQF